MSVSLICALFFLVLAATIPGRALAKLDIPYPFYAVSGPQNQVKVIEDGITALHLRVEMIRRAKKNIEVEYFIFNTDTAGKIIASELVAAAKRGVNVRVLVDKSFTVLKLKFNIAKELATHKVKLRYYNPAAIYRISTANFRNHRKLISVDDREAITGGRNMGDDYFDLSTHFNFNDRDIYIQGPMARALRDSFDSYYNHEISERPDLKQEVSVKDAAAAKAFLREGPAEVAARNRMSTVGKSVLSGLQAYSCPELTYATDAPGGDFSNRLDPEYSGNFRHLRKVLRDRISKVNERLIISSPYMIHNSRTEEIFAGLVAKKVKIHIYTNSLASTDAIYVAANMYLGLQDWLSKGVQVYLHDGHWPGLNPNTPVAIRNAIWGTHAKTQIYESTNSSEVMIGSYNVDNRSNFYNNELAVFCKGNPQFTAEVKRGIVALTERGLKVRRNNTAIDRHGKIKNIYGTEETEVIKMKAATLPSWLLKFLL